MKNYILPFIIILLLTACSHSRQPSEKEAVKKNEMKYAKRMRMYEKDGYTVAEILDGDSIPKVEATYVLLPSGVTPPAANPNIIVIPTPVNSALVYTSVHAAGMEELGKIDAINGVADADYFKIPAVRTGIDTGKIKNVGSSSSPSAEKIIELAPQVIIVNQYEGADYHTIDNVGIPLLKMAENLEETPLGRAEWIKLLGVLFDKRECADSIFNSVEKQYLSLKNSASSINNPPLVITETMYSGVWNVPGGNSYQAQLLADAGAKYPWSDTKQSGSIPLSFEQVLEKGADADIWLVNVYNVELTLNDLLAMDRRYANFAPAKNFNVWYCNTATKPLFEETPFHPERLLSDYVSIFSGKTDSLRYFNKIQQ